MQAQVLVVCPCRMIPMAQVSFPNSMADPSSGNLSLSGAWLRIVLTRLSELSSPNGITGSGKMSLSGD